MAFVLGSNHPCASHGCDLCKVCRSGRCCASAMATTVQPPLHAADLGARTEDVALDAIQHVSSAALIGHEVLARLAASPMLAGLQAAPLTPHQRPSAELPVRSPSSALFSTACDPVEVTTKRKESDERS